MGVILTLTMIVFGTSAQAAIRTNFFVACQMGHIQLSLKNDEIKSITSLPDARTFTVFLRDGSSLILPIANCMIEEYPVGQSPRLGALK